MFYLQIEHLKKKLDDMKTDHDKRKVSINSHLAKLQNQQDKRQDSNKQQEQQFASNQGDMRKRVWFTRLTYIRMHHFIHNLIIFPLLIHILVNK